MIATAATATVALTQAAQNANYVNNLTKNVTLCRLMTRWMFSLNIFEAVVITLGNELDAIKYQQGLLC
jgi:hypothetical protein